MTVRELREYLSRFHEDMPVVVCGYMYGFDDVLPEKTGKVKIVVDCYKDALDLYGRHGHVTPRSNHSDDSDFQDAVAIVNGSHSLEFPAIKQVRIPEADDLPTPGGY